jgi:hypothetical protein
LLDGCDVPRERNDSDSAVSVREITIDFVRSDPSAAKAKRAKDLYDQGRMCAEIARDLGVRRSFVTELLKREFAARGEQMPDGRSRRRTLTRKHLEPPQYQAIANEVMQYFEQDLLLHEIATRMKCNIGTVESAIRFWHQERGLPVPDGRARRKSLEVKQSPKRSRVNNIPAVPPSEGQAETGPQDRRDS